MKTVVVKVRFDSVHFLCILSFECINVVFALSGAMEWKPPKANPPKMTSAASSLLSKEAQRYFILG